MVGVNQLASSTFRLTPYCRCNCQNEKRWAVAVFPAQGMVADSPLKFSSLLADSRERILRFRSDTRRVPEEDGPSVEGTFDECLAQRGKLVFLPIRERLLFVNNNEIELP